MTDETTLRALRSTLEDALVLVDGLLAKKPEPRAGNEMDPQEPTTIDAVGVPADAQVGKAQQPVKVATGLLATGGRVIPEP